MSLRHRNQMDLFNPEEYKDKKIVIVWVWWVWSLTTLILAQMWIKNITIIDFDKIENHNISSQFYKTNQLEKLKVESLASNVEEFTWILPKAINEKYKPEHTEDADIIIMWVDDMEVRKDIVETSNPNLSFIDCRMAWEVFEVYTFTKYQKEIYMGNWYSNEDASPEVCTAKSISYNTAVIAGIIWKIVKDILSNKIVKYNYVVDLVNIIIG